MKLTAAQESLLTATEARRLKDIPTKHTEVAALIKDLRAVRALRQKQRDAVGKQTRAVKTGAKRPTRQVGVNDRTGQKEALFDEVVKKLEERLEALRDLAAAECPKKKPTKAGAANALLDRARKVIREDAKSLRDSASVNGRLKDTTGRIQDELDMLETLVKDIGVHLKGR